MQKNLQKNFNILMCLFCMAHFLPRSFCHPPPPAVTAPSPSAVRSLHSNASDFHAYLLFPRGHVARIMEMYGMYDEGQEELVDLICQIVKGGSCSLVQMIL